MWSPMGRPITRDDRGEEPTGTCRCSCYCREPATMIWTEGKKRWPVCVACYADLKQASWL